MNPQYWYASMPVETYATGIFVYFMNGSTSRTITECCVDVLKEPIKNVSQILAVTKILAYD